MNLIRVVKGFPEDKKLKVSSETGPKEICGVYENISKLEEAIEELPDHIDTFAGQVMFFLKRVQDYKSTSFCITGCKENGFSLSQEIAPEKYVHIAKIEFY